MNRSLAAVALTAIGLFGLFALAGCQTSAASALQSSAPAARSPEQDQRFCPAADFPTVEAFYPREARLAGLEGRSQVHVCIDETGQVTAPPSIVKSSGIAQLDEAAVVLAAAGSGHYLPALHDGHPIASCGDFRINFRLAPDPRFPTLSHRLLLTRGEFYQRGHALVEQARTPQILAHLQPGDAAQLAALQQYLSALPGVIQQLGDLNDEFLARVDQLAQAQDVSEEERAAFADYWRQERPREQQLWTRFVIESPRVVAIAQELADYLATTRPALDGTGAAATPTAAQAAHIKELQDRGREAVAEMKKSMLAACPDCGGLLSRLESPRPSAH
jgi:TonB family protein